MKTVRRKLPSAWLRASRVCVALGDLNRQRILLLFERDEELSMQQVLQTSTLSRTAVAHHLRVMREAGVLSARKAGKEVYWRIRRDYVREQLGAVIAYIDAEL